MTEEGRLPQGSGRPAFKCVFESVPSIKQDSARNTQHSQLGCHLNGSQAQHSWRCSHDLSPRLRKTGHSFCLPEATLQLHLSIECLLMHRAGRHRPPHWKGRAVQAPASGSSPYNTARSQTDQHPTLNQQIPETGFSKEKLKSGVPRGLPWHSPKPLPRPHRFFSTTPTTFFVPPCRGARTVDYLPPSLCPVGWWQSWGRRR